MKTSSSILALFICCAVPLSATARESQDGFWGMFDVGWAETHLDHSISGIQSSGKVFMNLGGGYHWGKQLYVALETGGLGLEYSNLHDPSVGAGISPYLVAMRYYVAPDGPYFLQVGAGRSHYWTNQANENGGWGKAFKIGGGWDIAVHGYDYVYITPSINLYSGDYNETTITPSATQRTKYRAVSFSVGLTLR